MSAPAVLPPDARLRRPRRPLPRGTVDCHAHIFDRFERYPFSSWKKCSPSLCSREAWLALHAALGVERGVQVHGSPYGFDVSVDLSAGSWKGGFDYGYWGPQVYLTARF